MLAGHGLVYNPGERVEGYTNFLWAMLLALPAALGMKIEVAAKMLGLAFGAATIVATTALANAWIGTWFAGKRKLLLLLPGVLLGASGPFAMWTLGGLEAVFFTFLLVCATLVYLADKRPRAMFLTGILLALLVMTRPDGIVFVGAFLVHLALQAKWDADSSLKQRLKCGVQLLVAFAIVFLPYFVWRYSYYGYIFPNTFYAKVGGGTGSVVRGLKYAWLFFSTYGFIPVAAAAVYFYARMQQASAMAGYDRDRRIASLLLLQIVLYLLFIVGVGGDQLVMKRFFVPLLPALYLLSTRGFAELFTVIKKESAGEKYLAPAGVALAILMVAIPTFTGREHTRIFEAEKPADADRKLVGEWLRENLDEQATVALIPAGITPYYSGVRIIDLVGLNDTHIAHTDVPDFGKGEPGHEKYDSAYVLQRRPELIFLGACRIWPEKLAPDVLENYYWMYGKLAPGNKEMLRQKELKMLYVPCAAKIDSGYVHFLKRNDFFFQPAEPLTPATGTG
jgi:arabinofuranosyltransferase